MGKAEQSLDEMLKKQNMASSKMDSTRDNTVYYLKHQCVDKIQQKCKKFFEDAKVFDKVDSIMKYLLSHPLLLAGFIIITATLVIPIFLFTIFAIINVAIAFTSFIIIEVMLLMIGMTVLSCIMFLIITTIAVVAISFLLSFYVTYFSFSLVRKKLISK